MTAQGFTSSIYGLKLHSNLPISGLIDVPFSESFDVEITFVGDDPASLALDSQTSLQLPRQRFDKTNYHVWRLADGGRRIMLQGDGQYFEFLIDAAGRHIRAAWAGMTHDEMLGYLLGMGLGALLRLRRIICLHSSALLLPGADAAFLVCGVSGAGKSTTAAALMRAGCRVISDDAAPLIERAGQFRVLPGNPRLRLRADAAQALFGATEPLTSVLPDRDHPANKFYMPNDSALSVAEVPVAAIYLLGARSFERRDVKITALSGVDALMGLLAHSYLDHVLDWEGRLRSLGQFKRVSEIVPVRRIERPEGLEALSTIRDAILEDARRLVG